MRRKLLGFLAFSSLFLILVNAAAATMYLSVPSDVPRGDNATLIVEESDFPNFDANFTVSNSSGAQYTTVKSAADNVASATFNTSILDPGDYRVNISVSNSSEGLEKVSRSSFSVSSGLSGAALVELSSRNINGSECPMDKSESMYGDCKLFGVDLQVNTSSGLANISESGEPLTATVGKIHIGLVDRESSGSYDTVFWDDDAEFLESNETGDDSQSYVRVGDKVVDFTADNTSLSLYSQRVGENIVFAVPPAPSERPYRKGDEIEYSIFGYREIGPSYLNYYPATGKELSAVSTNLNTGDTKNLPISNTTTNSYGFTGKGSISSAEVGRHKVNIANVSSVFYEVRSFDISYEVRDASTGERKSTFQPGDSVSVRAVPTVDGDRTDYEEITIEVIDPSGNRYTHVMQNSVSTTFRLPEDVAAGRATVSISVKGQDGATQTASTSFEVKKFRVHTVPLKKQNGGATTAETIGPNSTGYAFVGAVKLGTYGGVQAITGADFYLLDNPNTSEDECSENVGEIKGTLDGESLDIKKTTNLTSSSLFSDSSRFPEDMKTQCIVKFEVEEDVSGFFTGTVEAQRATTNDTEQGQVDFGVKRYRVDGRTRSPSTDDWKWEFGKTERVGIKPWIIDISDREIISGSRIESASIISVEGDGESISVSNSSFNSSGNNLISFNAPDSTGDYRVRFRTEINTTGNVSETETVTGMSYFEVKIFEVDSEIVRPSWSYEVTPDQSLTLETAVTEQGSDSALQGVKLEIKELENIDTEMSYVNKTIYGSGTTDVNGSTRINITPKYGWEKGTYRMKLEARNSQEETGYDYEYFRVKKYEKGLSKIVAGKGCDYDCELVKGENLSIVPEAKKLSSNQKIPVTDINLAKSSLVNRGNSQTYSYEKVPLENHVDYEGSTELNGKSYYALNISTETLDSGLYSLYLNVDLQNGETVEINNYDSFAVNAFRLNLTKTSSQEAFQPGSNITYNISASENANYTVDAGEFESYDYLSGEEMTINPNVSRSFEGSSTEFNLSIPDSAGEGEYSGQVEISNGESTQFVRTRFDVSSVNLVYPSRFEVRFDEYDKLEKEAESFYETNETQEGSGCPDLKSGENITLNENLSGKGCWYSEESMAGQDYHAFVVNPSNTSTWENAWVYLGNDTDFEDGQNLARNASLNSSTGSTQSGLRFNITSITQNQLEIKPVNGYVTYEGAFVLDNRTGETYLADIDESWGPETDLTGDGDTDDEVNAVAKNISGEWQGLRITTDSNLSKDASTTYTISERGSADLNGQPVYAADFRNSTWGKTKIDMYTPQPGDSYVSAAIKTSGGSYAFPIKASYPNGTAIKSKQVNVSQIISTDGSRTISSDATAVTDSRGIAFLDITVPQTELVEETFSIISAIKHGGEVKKLEEYRSPRIRVKKFSKEEEIYREFSVGQLKNYSNTTADKTEQEIEAEENISLEDDFRSTEYWFTRFDEADRDCADLNDNYECGEQLSILLSNETSEPLDPDALWIEEDNSFYKSSFSKYYLFGNTSSVELKGEDLEVFGIFDKSSNDLNAYLEEHDILASQPAYLSLRFTEVFDQNAGKTGNVTVNSVTYEGKTFNATQQFDQEMGAEGGVFFKLPRTAFSGADSQWPPESVITFHGKASGTEYEVSVGTEEVEE